jgi:hypothetical protein
VRGRGPASETTVVTRTVPSPTLGPHYISRPRSSADRVRDNGSLRPLPGSSGGRLRFGSAGSQLLFSGAGSPARRSEAGRENTRSETGTQRDRPRRARRDCIRRLLHLEGPVPSQGLLTSRGRYRRRRLHRRDRATRLHRRAPRPRWRAPNLVGARSWRRPGADRWWRRRAGLSRGSARIGLRPRPTPRRPRRRLLAMRDRRFSANDHLRCGPHRPRRCRRSPVGSMP